MGARLSHVIHDSSNSDEYECVGCCGGYHPSPQRRRSFNGKQKKKKKRVMELLAAEAKRNEVLSRTVGRICSNGSTSNACVFTQQGRKGINQDAMIVWENFDSSNPNTTFCGVFDGHGPFGHLVARKVRDALPSKISALKLAEERNTVATTDSAASASTAEQSLALEEHQKWFKAWRDCFIRAYHTMDKELKSHPTIDSFCSGTTAVTMLLQGRDMVIANVGDSRAILGTLSANDDSKVEAVQLTVDLKPNLPLEAERIKRCKGRVFALEDEPEVARVWLPHDDSPGLAMARAFGDFCLKDFGLIAVPEVTYARITERDQFIVLASDGIWDVLSNKEVVETIWEAPTRTTAARALVETAVRAWRLKYPTSKVDDCAVVCFFFNKQQRHQGLPDITVSASSASASSSSSSSTISLMAEVELNANHLPVTSVSSLAATVLEATVHSKSDQGQTDPHDSNFCASASPASILDVKEKMEVQEELTERVDQKMSANSTKTASIAEDHIHLEPAASEIATEFKAQMISEGQTDPHDSNFCASASPASILDVKEKMEVQEELTERVDQKMSANSTKTASIAELVAEDHIHLEPAASEIATEFKAQMISEGGNKNIVCQHGEGGIMQRSDTLRSGSAGAIAIIAPLSSASVDKTSSYQSDSTQGNENSTELPIVLKEDGDVQHWGIVFTEEAVSSQLTSTSSLTLEGPIETERSASDDYLDSTAENTSSLRSSLAAESSFGPESDQDNAIALSTDHIRNDIQTQNDQKNVSHKPYHHNHIDTETLQSTTPSAKLVTPTCTTDFVAATRCTSEFEGAPSEITVMTEEEADGERISPFLGRSASRRSLAECLSVADDEEWSALEGVARVNSLLNLPRFLQRGRPDIMRRANSSSCQSTRKKTPWKLLSWNLLSFKRIAQKISARRNKRRRMKKQKKFSFEEGAEEQIRIWY